jgi:hypothetical protein
MNASPSCPGHHPPSTFSTQCCHPCIIPLVAPPPPQQHHSPLQASSPTILHPLPLPPLFHPWDRCPAHPTKHPLTLHPFHRLRTSPQKPSTSCSEPAHKSLPPPARNQPTKAFHLLLRTSPQKPSTSCSEPAHKSLPPPAQNQPRNFHQGQPPTMYTMRER